jgi:hypothetical protein
MKLAPTSPFFLLAPTPRLSDKSAESRHSKPARSCSRAVWRPTMTMLEVVPPRLGV